MTMHRHCQLQSLHRDPEGLRRRILCIPVRPGENDLLEAEGDAVERSAGKGWHRYVCSRCSMAAWAKASPLTFSLNLILPS